MVNSLRILPAAIEAFERRYRNDHRREHGLLVDRLGRIIVERTGEFDRIEFVPEELERAIGGTLTHTHPRALSFSRDDLALAAEYGLTMRAVGVAPDTGDMWEYTLQMPAADTELADKLFHAFDDELDAAEKELAKMPVDDLEWQRAARHAAVERLSQEYNFNYQRVLRKAHLSEARGPERARLNMLSNAEKTLRQQVFDPLNASLSRMLSRYGGNGTIPAEALDNIRREIASLSHQTMLGKPDAAGVLAPYSITRGQVVPRSIYFATLWTLMQNAAAMAIGNHADIMRHYLPEDLIRQFENATINPAEQADPLHMWVGPDGKKLADRVWLAAGDLSRRLDNYITEAVSAGRRTASIISGLERYMRGAGTYEPMRLGRTQTTIAYSQADWIAAQGNPFVETYSFHTAPQHKCCDECDDVEAGSPYPKDDMTHMPPRHPECICTVIWNLVSDINSVVEGLRAKIEKSVAKAARSLADIIGPLSKRLLGLLFGGRNE